MATNESKVTEFRYLISAFVPAGLADEKIIERDIAKRLLAVIHNLPIVGSTKVEAVGPGGPVPFVVHVPADSRSSLAARPAVEEAAAARFAAASVPAGVPLPPDQGVTQKSTRWGLKLGWRIYRLGPLHVVVWPFLWFGSETALRNLFDSLGC